MCKHFPDNLRGVIIVEIITPSLAKFYHFWLIVILQPSDENTIVCAMHFVKSYVSERLPGRSTARWISATGATQPRSHRPGFYHIENPLQKSVLLSFVNAVCINVFLFYCDVLQKRLEVILSPRRHRCSEVCKAACVAKTTVEVGLRGGSRGSFEPEVNRVAWGTTVEAQIIFYKSTWVSWVEEIAKYRYTHVHMRAHIIKLLFKFTYTRQARIIFAGVGDDEMNTTAGLRYVVLSSLTLLCWQLDIRHSL